MVALSRDVPDRLYVSVPGLRSADARRYSSQAVKIAKAHSPKLSGTAARGIDTYYGDGFFGIKWRSPYLFYVEKGTKGRTMKSLAGKVVPMWLDDPTGKVRRENPKAKTRTLSGRRQTLIFRRAAKIGQRKRKSVTRGGVTTVILVPAAYPGAPGRIAKRSVPGGRIVSHGPRGPAKPHAGVRWYNPGIVGREFLRFSLVEVCHLIGHPYPQVLATYRRR